MAGKVTKEGELAVLELVPPLYDYFNVQFLKQPGEEDPTTDSFSADAVWIEGVKSDGSCLVRWLADNAGTRPRVKLTGYFGDYPYVEKVEFFKGE